MESYQHFQRSPFFLLIYAIAGLNVALAWVVPGAPVVGYILVGSGAAIAMLGLGFHHLAVKDDDDQLRVQFGPLPLLGTSIRYNEIKSVGRDRMKLHEVWGINKSLRGGWAWSIWGRDCVVVDHALTTTRIGTNDVDNLLAHLSTRTGLSPHSSEE